jgi:hypothetical protein
MRDAEVAISGHAPDLDEHPESEAGMRVGDFSRLIVTIHGELHVAADRFLGFGKRAINDARAAGVDEHAFRVFEGLSFGGFALSNQAVVPGVLVGDEVLGLGQIEVPVVFRARVFEKQQV